MIGRIVKYKIGETVYEGEVLDKYQGLTHVRLPVGHGSGISMYDNQMPMDFYIIRVKGLNELKHVRCERIKEVVEYTPVDTGPA